MKKTTLLTGILKQLISNPKSIRRVLDVDEYYSRQNQKKHKITALPTLDIRALFPRFAVEIEKYTYLEGTSLPIDIALIKELAGSFAGCRYFELGCWRGESLINVSSVAKNCTSLSLSAAEMESMGFPKEVIEQNHFFTKGLSNVEYIEHNSLTFDFSSIIQRFDVIFVDGDHHYESVLSDTKNVVKLLRDETSVLVWHDYGFSPERPRPEVLAGILDGLPPEMHKYLRHVSNTLCAIMMRKDLPAKKPALFPVYPDKTFNVSIKVKNIQ